jgi:exopolyphosphatase/guanosine-5'-triphosphate,3'-diphosphate pyrophosphatase
MTLKREWSSDILKPMRKQEGGQYVLRAAAIDVGTNSTRFLIADVGEDRGFQRVFADRRITRLGEGVHCSGRLNEKAMQRTLETLCLFLSAAQDHGADRIAGAATSAVRSASNGDSFVHRIRHETGLELQILSGEEEAHCMAQGISLLWSDPPDRWTAVDIGGGSTEIAMAERNIQREVLSVPLGMVHLTENLLKHDPPQPFEVEHCKATSHKVLSKVLSNLATSHESLGVVVGTAGTITTLTAMELGLDPYDGEKVNGYHLGREAADRWCQKLARMDDEQRRRIPGMEPGREDVILAGTIILCELLRVLGVNEIIVSDYGLLEGIAFMAAQVK